MRMKEDHMRNGQLKAGCNVQIGTEGQFVVSYTLPRRAGDAACMIEHLEHLRRTSGTLPDVVVADAGYGSEENYAYLESRGVEAFVKYSMFHKEQKRSFKADPTQPKNWAFDEKSDTWTHAPGVAPSPFLKEKAAKSELGFESTTRLYHCDDCSGCPHRARCAKSEDGPRNRTIYTNPSLVDHRNQAERRLARATRGSLFRRRRATDVETVFGDIKSNWRFKRFTLRGLAKATHERGLVALGHNMRKIAQDRGSQASVDGRRIRLKERGLSASQTKKGCNPL